MSMIVVFEVRGYIRLELISIRLNLSIVHCVCFLFCISNFSLLYEDISCMDCCMFTRLIMCHKSKFIDAGNIEMIFISSIAAVFFSVSLSLTHILWISIYNFKFYYYYFMFSFLDFSVCSHW